MFIVSGKTFEHRGFLKTMGGEWNADEKHWEFRALSDNDRKTIANMVGCSLSERKTEPRQKPKPQSDNLREMIAAILGNNGKDEKPTTANRTTEIYGDDQRYFNYFKDKNPSAFFGFSSLGAMCDYVEQTPQRGPGWKTSGWREDWSGAANMSEALALARNGWQAGFENAAEIVDALTVAHAVKRRRQLGVTGGHVSVGRMLSGNPVHMVKRAKLPGRRIVTLFVEGIASAAIDAETIIIRAALVAAICDAMEQEGYSLEIVSIVAMRDDDDFAGAQTAVTIKHAGEKFNLFDLVFALGNPAFLRRLHFACVTSSEACYSMWDDQGMPSEAFNTIYPTARNEFYIRHLTMREQAAVGEEGSLRERALRMLPFIEPTNLPIKITEQS